MNYQTLIEQFTGQKILVIGDLMLDVYLSGSASRIAREAPVPIVSVQTREDVPGGAANAAVNLAALGAQVTLLTLTGDDRDGRCAIDLLTRHGVNSDTVLCDPERETIVKKRVLSNDQLLIRYDQGTTAAPPPAWEKRLIAALRGLYSTADAVLISDYGYGVVSDKLIAALQTLRAKTPKPLVIDSKDLRRFCGLSPDAVKPNYEETARLLRFTTDDKSRRVELTLAHGSRVLKLSGARIAAVTLDSDGAILFERGKQPYRTYASATPHSRAVGAGDTYVSALTLALSIGASAGEAGEIAAAAASVVVRKDGTATCSAGELIDCFAPPQKIVGRHAALTKLLAGYRAAGKRIVFTNGCFDILHRGHVTYLAQAKQRGDVLIVGINTDTSVRRLKGRGRPINPLEDRMAVLAALDCVDHVVSIGENTPIELIKLIEPDVFVKGGNYAKANLPEAPVVESLGGIVEILPYVLDRSTSAVIRKIRVRSSSGD